MRSVAATALMLDTLAIAPAPAQEVPQRNFIVSMAQQFVLKHFRRKPEDHFSVAFDVTELHPQPEGNYWAVVGGFRALGPDAQYHSHIFVAAVRLVCTPFKELKCWRLEKLAIDRDMLVDDGKPI